MIKVYIEPCTDDNEDLTIVVTDKDDLTAISTATFHGYNKAPGKEVLEFLRLHDALEVTN